MSHALVELLTRHTAAGENPFTTAVPGLTLLRSDHERLPKPMLHMPALCVVAQGAKCTTFGEASMSYRAGQALVVSVDTPASSRVVEASPERPYLGVVIELDLGVLREVLGTLASPPVVVDDARPGIFVTDFDGPLDDAVLRMVRLLDTPAAIAVLAPSIMREIGYWLLSGPHGGDVARLALAGSHARRVIDAIHLLRERFAEPVRIDVLAQAAQMSLSVFHRQFKALTSMTPLQYQKQLRLMEARRLIVGGATTIEAAAFRVGYESPSQFSREYARMFGAPPRRDMQALRTAMA